ncbi:MAG TPA: DUF3789 domain-containing protein [Dialister sp.]|nr:DUF3789 domain-containing protein [Dialister sp.]
MGEFFAFICGMFAGASVGLIVFALCYAADKGDRM